MSLDLLEQAIASTGAVLSNVSGGQYDRSTPCASWDVRALVNHIVGSCDWFTATVETAVAPASEHGEFQGDVTGGDINATYAERSKRALEAFSASGAMEKILKLPFGEMPGAAFVMMAANDQFQHGWDLAKATGQAIDFDPDLAAKLLEFVQAAIPDAFRGPDGQAPFGPVVAVDEPAPAADRLAGFLGRTP